MPGKDVFVLGQLVDVVLAGILPGDQLTCLLLSAPIITHSAHREEVPQYSVEVGSERLLH